MASRSRNSSLAAITASRRGPLARRVSVNVTAMATSAPSTAASAPSDSGVLAMPAPISSTNSS